MLREKKALFRVPAAAGKGDDSAHVLGHLPGVAVNTK
jgi:hypothetical protein